MLLQDIVNRLEAQANPANVAGMARYGIETRNTLGVNIPTLRTMAKEIGKDHKLARTLWKCGMRETRILATLVDEPARVTEAQMERWVKQIDSWDVCDQCCNDLFRYTPFAYQKAVAWSKRPEEFVKRAGFVLMAALALHDKKVPDQTFLRFLPIIKREAVDERNFVRKAVNWALRQIGKRNAALRRQAIQTAKEIQALDSKIARWVAADALRELKSEVNWRLQTS